MTSAMQRRSFPRISHRLSRIVHYLLTHLTSPPLSRIAHLERTLPCKTTDASFQDDRHQFSRRQTPVFKTTDAINYRPRTSRTARTSVGPPFRAEHLPAEGLTAERLTKYLTGVVTQPPLSHAHSHTESRRVSHIAPHCCCHAWRLPSPCRPISLDLSACLDRIPSIGAKMLDSGSIQMCAVLDSVKKDRKDA